MVMANGPPDIEEKVLRLTIARYVLFALSALFTALYVISANGIKLWYMWPLVFIGALAAQYVFTEFESALFSGKIPHPLHSDATAVTNWIWIAAVAILLFDMLLQVGGVGTFLRYVDSSMTGDILMTDFGLSSGFISGIKVTMILVLSLLSAIGCEVLGMYIKYIQERAEEAPKQAIGPVMLTPEKPRQQQNGNSQLLLNSNRKGNTRP